MLGQSSQVPVDARSEVPDWNVIVTLSEPTFRIARNLLARWGRLRRTEYHNVAVMRLQTLPPFFKSLFRGRTDAGHPQCDVPCRTLRACVQL
jgi:hypothetical protein